MLTVIGFSTTLVELTMELGIVYLSWYSLIGTSPFFILGIIAFILSSIFFSSFIQVLLIWLFIACWNDENKCYPGPPIGESNYEEAVEFDPIKHHNFFCPWVNGNVAAAGCSNSGSSSSNSGAIALCGWQLTLDALDSFQSLGHIPVQTVESESAASLYKVVDFTYGIPSNDNSFCRLCEGEVVFFCCF